MKQGKMYLVGAMTRYKITLMHRTNRLMGVRFRPGSLSLFSKDCKLDGLTNQTTELEDTWLQGIRKLTFKADELNHFFTVKLSNNLPTVLNIVQDIQQHKGNVRITELAERHYHTTRQIERLFKKYVGLSAKELSNIMRYKEALNVIQQHRNLTLQDIADICGYYDHSHLTKDIVRYTGCQPSQL
ncbi:MAG: helix-turn-helix transcriptional regulator [Bacteroidetes bacterium]|nr:helix-turn-helix transcriptional regulator [Bacteroidota bacterium]